MRGARLSARYMDFSTAEFARKSLYEGRLIWPANSSAQNDRMREKGHWVQLSKRGSTQASLGYEKVNTSILFARLYDNKLARSVVK